MPLKPEQIEAGKCYKTRGKEAYKVISITRGIITYRTWTSPLRVNAPVKGFAEAVTAEVPCPGNL